MAAKKVKLEDLYRTAGFKPNKNQKQAIETIDGPVFLMAGPGSGKTSVLLWRTVNLIAFHNVKPADIFLSTFTEKASLQLRQGLLSLLAMVTNETGQVFDLSPMYVGTVHSLCSRLLTDRRFVSLQQYRRSPIVLDPLDQYFFIHSRQFWEDAKAELGLSSNLENVFMSINKYFDPKRDSKSRHWAVTNLISLFNRLSEECLQASEVINKSRKDTGLKDIARLYKFYLERLSSSSNRPRVDLSLLQQEGLKALQSQKPGYPGFRYIIIDEYQDTNTVQERLFFELARHTCNLCVVGDDDQALYRFRGATVENLVNFPGRCSTELNRKPRDIILNTNYRSRQEIVDFYCDFIDRADWSRPSPQVGHYRIPNKQIKAYRSDTSPSVVATQAGAGVDVMDEIAGLAHQLIDQGIVQDPNQIAVLFPAIKSSVQVERLMQSMEARGLKVYAPRAGQFLDCDEPKAVFGIFLKLFGKPTRDMTYDFGLNKKFHDWMEHCLHDAEELIDEDQQLDKFLEDLRVEIEEVSNDYELIDAELGRQSWQTKDPYEPMLHKKVLANIKGLSVRARRELSYKRIDYLYDKAKEDGKSLALGWVINRITSLDWNVLDLFYWLCGFDYFKAMFNLAESGADEGPVCNLSLTSQYLARFIDQRINLLSGSVLQEGKFANTFFTGFLGAIYRLGESEYENEDEPFPRGRISFLTIHQAKGLEFPVVILANPAKRDRGPQRVEEIVRPFLNTDREPLDRVSKYDAMRMFYVALSRAQDLLVLGHLQGRGISLFPPLKDMLESKPITRINSFDPATLPAPPNGEGKISKVYSYTADFLNYNECPRRYMIFRKYGFNPARSTTMFFGSLVHRTLEDLHRHLMERRG